MDGGHEGRQVYGRDGMGWGRKRAGGEGGRGRQVREGGNGRGLFLSEFTLFKMYIRGAQNNKTNIQTTQTCKDISHLDQYGIRKRYIAKFTVFCDCAYTRITM